MGQMALGYGSEFHLLRWMGRHREEFDKQVKKVLGINNIAWRDFEFHCNAIIQDKEIKGIDFIKFNEELLKTWKNEWPQTGNPMNWDAIGYYTDNNQKKVWILVEAKAHIGEINSKCNAETKSRKKIESILQKTANNLKLDYNNCWLEKYYQQANRLYVYDLLKRNGIEAKLLNIYFVGDMSNRSRKSPQTQADWVKPITDKNNCFRIPSGNDYLYDMFLDVCRKDNNLQI